MTGRPRRSAIPAHGRSRCDRWSGCCWSRASRCSSPGERISASSTTTPYAEILGEKHPRSLGARFSRHLVGNLGRHQPADRRGDGRRSELPPESAAAHEPARIRRADLVHLLLLAGARRARQGRRDVLRGGGNHADGARRTGAEGERGALPPDRRQRAGADLGHQARPHALVRQPGLSRFPRPSLRGSDRVRLAQGAASGRPAAHPAGADRRRSLAQAVRAGGALQGRRRRMALAALGIAAALGPDRQAYRLHRRRP